MGATGELTIGGHGGQRISIPPGWTYSFDFNIQAVDPNFNVSTWRGWGTVQNTGVVVAGTLDGLKMLTAGGGIASPLWCLDGAGNLALARMFGGGGPGIELPAFWLIFDTDSATGEIVIHIGGTGAAAAAWYALVVINKVFQSAGYSYSSRSH